jgi:hypothetical protein
VYKIRWGIQKKWLKNSTVKNFAAYPALNVDYFEKRSILTIFAHPNLPKIKHFNKSFLRERYLV